MKLSNLSQTLAQAAFGILVLCAFALNATRAEANNRYENYQGQGVWSFDSDKQSIKVFIKGLSVYAQTRDSADLLPAIRLKKINSNLLNDYTDHYVLIEDFNNNGWQDIGVLKSVGFDGKSVNSMSHYCYAVFEYQPDFYGFRAHSSKTVCF